MPRVRNGRFRGASASGQCRNPLDVGSTLEVGEREEHRSDAFLEESVVPLSVRRNVRGMVAGREGCRFRPPAHPLHSSPRVVTVGTDDGDVEHGDLDFVARVDPPRRSGDAIPRSCA